MGHHRPGCTIQAYLLLLTVWQRFSGSRPHDLDVNARRLEVITTQSQHNCSRSFLSLGFPHFFYKWKKFPLGSQKVIGLANALPGTIARIYGTPLFTEDDMQHFEENNWRRRRRSLGGDDGPGEGSAAQDVSHDPKKLVLTRHLWVSLVNFVRQVKWKIMFDFTAFEHVKGQWESRYAKTFLDMSQRENIPIPEFQLGNEPNLYDKSLKINGTTVATDFAKFWNLLKEYPLYHHSRIIGPDVTRFMKSKTYFEQFLKAGGCDHVDEISFHHYYYRNNATLNNFLDIPTLDTYMDHIKVGLELMKKYNCDKPLRLTETSSSVGGGTPDLSDTFVAGFSWMDKLGQSALHRITCVFRHSFFGGYYSLINSKLEPNPDYYLSALFKKYVEGPVFSVKGQLPSHIRAYANCAREYPPGSVVFYLMNMSGSKPEYVNFTQYFLETLSVYRFTPWDYDVKSRRVMLNGEELTMRGNVLPYMRASRELGDKILMPPHSYAFVIASHAKAAPCVDYFRHAAEGAGGGGGGGGPDAQQTSVNVPTTSSSNRTDEDDQNSGQWSLTYKTLLLLLCVTLFFRNLVF